MVFSSATFLFLFLPVVLTGYFALRGTPLRNLFLLTGSLLFYSWGETIYLMVLLLSIACNTFFGNRISRSSDNTRRLYLSAAVATNLLLLGYFKYANFITDNVNLALSIIHVGPVDLAPVHLPLGISFFTFQAISYIVDIYRGDAQVQKRYSSVALYIALFPQLIAGPIVRYASIEKQLSERTVSATAVAEGIRRFIIGLAKKILLANAVGDVADDIFDHSPSDLSPLLAWLGIVCYTLQIYFDFSGYSDMAIGLGRMLGFKFPENFRHPYISTSVQEFWRRWHISLSSWFRDYVYIPLGGNRGPQWRVYANLVIVFFLCGLWHGASWTFVIWGLYHGLFLVIERLGFAQLLQRLPSVARHVYLLLVVMFGWVLFRSENIGYAFGFIGTMIGISEQSDSDGYLMLYLNLKVIGAIAAGIVFSMPISEWIQERWHRFAAGTGGLIVQHALLIALFAGAATMIAAQTHNPFIYFRF